MVSKTDRTRLYSQLLAAASLPLLLILVWWLHDSLAYVRSTTPTGVGIFWSGSEVTLNLRLGCPPNENLSAWGPCWDDAARDAAQQWNAVGARFTFRIQSPSQPAEPTCSGANADHINTVVWADTNCGMAFGNDTLAITQSWFHSTGELVDSDVLFNTTHSWSTYSGPQRFGVVDFHRVAIHEFGHVLGLGHPDEHGQSVSAIMNSKTGNIDRLQTDDINGTRAIYGSASTGSTRTSALGIPGPGSTQSGVGVISGWKCRANGRLTVRFDGGPAIPLVYGSERPDVRNNGACLENGHDNVGFVAIWNWGRLAKGRHTAVVYDNGTEFARSTFTVVTTGVEFLSGVTGSGTATLSNGQRATLMWSEASQSFVATEFTASRGSGGSDDHGDTRQEATAVSLPSDTLGRLEARSDEDYFRLSVPRSGTLTVETTGSTDTHGTLYTASGGSLVSNDDSGSGTNFRIVRSVSAGTYYVRVSGSANARTGSYTLRVSFTAAGGGGGNSLNDLLGTWRFTFTIISTFTDIYRLSRIDTSTGTPLIAGTNEYGDPVVAGRIQDVNPGNPLPYEFALLEPSDFLICRFFVFNKTGNNSVEGLYFQIDVRNGVCGTAASDISNPSPMTGIRTSRSTSSIREQSTPRDTVLGQQNAELQSLVETTTLGLSSPDEATSAAIRDMISVLSSTLD